MQKSILWITFVILFPIIAPAQSGFQFYGGIHQAQNRSELITPPSHSHSGFLYGIDLRLNEGKMYFGGGLEMSKVNFIAAEEKSYFSVENSMNWLKLRFGLGFRLFEVPEKFLIRFKTYASINMITSYPEDLIEAPYSNYNSGVAAAVGGLGFDIYFITVDLEYERGFFNAVNQVSGTEFDFYKLAVGFKI